MNPTDQGLSYSFPVKGMKPAGLGLVETELSSELFRWGQAIVAAPASERAWIASVGWTFRTSLLRPKKMDRRRQVVGRRCQEVDSWHSLVVVSLLGDGGYSSNQFDIWLRATPRPKGLLVVGHRVSCL